MHPSLTTIQHRPWPIPNGAWTWRQSWQDLLFVHWPVPASQLRPLVHDSLEIDEFDGVSWVGLVPFRMSGVAPRYVPELPGVSAFPELNLRLYVRYQDKPGVWFLSLDAANRLAVWAARRCFHLPYFFAQMECREDAQTMHYRSSRRDGPHTADFAARYRPTATPERAKAGSLEYFLTERYCLYASDRGGRLMRAEVHHAPWPLQKGEWELDENEVGRPWGLDLSPRPTTLHFSRRLDVIVWSPKRIA